MFIDYENPEQYFTGEPTSVSTLMCGKSKRKLYPITISLWETVRRKQAAEIDGSIREIPYSYFGVEITGEISEKYIIEGFTNFEAHNGVTSCLYSSLDHFVARSGFKLYVNNYAGEEWCKVELEEMFLGLTK